MILWFVTEEKERKERRTKNIAEKEARVMEVTMEREFGKLEEKLVVVDEQFFEEADSSDAVSYTHLTLPTKA